MEELLSKPWGGQGNTAKGLERSQGDLSLQSWASIHLSKQGLNMSSLLAIYRLYPYEPFETLAASYTAWAEQYLVLIADGQLDP